MDSHQITSGIFQLTLVLLRQDVIAILFIICKASNHGDKGNIGITFSDVHKIIECGLLHIVIDYSIMSEARLDPEESMKHILVSASRSETIFLVHVHFCALFLASSVSKISHFVKLLLKLIVAVALKWEAKVCRVGLVACIGPLALGCVTRNKLFLLLF